MVEPPSIRLPPDVKEQAKQAAADDDRSLNSYVVKVVTERLIRDGYLKGKRGGSDH